MKSRDAENDANNDAGGALRAVTAALVSLVALWGLLGPAAPAAYAASAPPRLADGFGLTVVRQPQWADDDERTFFFSLRSEQVPVYAAMEGQIPDEHVVMVTLPAGYGDDATRYPVLYNLHGAGDLPNAMRNKVIPERATEGVPLITVTPNGGGKGWYTNWLNPGELGPQNWRSFHLDELIPFVDANLRTVATREGRSIAGHSMGGLGAFHYAETRPELFSYVGSFSGTLDLHDSALRAAVVGSGVIAAYGTPLNGPDAVFGPPVWPLDGGWNAASAAQNVAPLRGMGVAMYAGNGGDLTVDPALSLAEKVDRQSAVTTAAHLRAAGIPYRFADYGDGTGWGEGCNGKHNQDPCLQADMDDFVKLIAKRPVTSR
ncbi:alpha/beta hydrolase-fold protein [Streptomyces sp. CA-210063]|uniref:alpha/beta hydrolase n=1 Tax=Streptomyces sp. CA-210063 TaxID=2801029 RepID=UPI00214C88E2|nr:alpha/beta hydrolase-fold protein [Streptomyces sp. CA-210063]UUU31680.1 alpha/beta hydrolase-fold protein [Streptomyces sp. CA-210063]